MAAEPVEMMRSVVHDARCAAKSFGSVGADDVEALLRVAQDAVNVVQEVQRLAVAAALQCDVWSGNGFRSPVQWLAAVTAVPLWLARSVVERAEVMSRLPLVQSVALAGGLHEIQVRDLFQLAERVGPFSSVDVDVDAAVAADDGPAALAAAMRRMHQCLEAEEAEAAEAERVRRAAEARDVKVDSGGGDRLETTTVEQLAVVGHLTEAGPSDDGSCDGAAEHGDVEHGDVDPLAGRTGGSNSVDLHSLGCCPSGPPSSTADSSGLFGGDGPVRPGRFTLFQRSDGWWEGTVLLPPVDGEIVAAALDREVDRYLRSRRDGDPSLEQFDIPALRAQALVDVVAIRREPSGYSTPDRFQVALNLHVGPEGSVRADRPFPAEAVCDSEIFRIALGADGEVLDVGRATRQWTPALSRAIRRRDQHCRFPDCDRPSRLCDIHHCRHWEHEGPTSVGNGVLLCRWHHTYIHRHRWRAELDPDTQKPTVYRSDGTIHTTAAQRAARE